MILWRFIYLIYLYSLHPEPKWVPLVQPHLWRSSRLADAFHRHWHWAHLSSIVQLLCWHFSAPLALRSRCVACFVRPQECGLHLRRCSCHGAWCKAQFPAGHRELRGAKQLHGSQSAGQYGRGWPNREHPGMTKSSQSSQGFDVYWEAQLLVLGARDVQLCHLVCNI